MTRRSLFAGLLGGAFSAPAQDKFLPLAESAYPKLLAARKGKVLLVDFWATWCAPCREELPLLTRLEAAVRPKGFTLLTVSADEPEQEKEAIEFLKKCGTPRPWYIKRANNDEKFITSVDPKWGGALPALFLYDRQGRKVKTWIGETPMAELEAAVKKLL